MFLPPYCPELNSIESLWSIIKGNIKTRLVQATYKTITQKEFENIMQECVDAVTPQKQANAARYNNRDFIHRQLSDYLGPKMASEEEALL